MPSALSRKTAMSKCRRSIRRNTIHLKTELATTQRTAIRFLENAGGSGAEVLKLTERHAAFTDLYPRHSQRVYQPD